MQNKSDTPKIVGAVVMTTMVLVVAYFVLIAPNSNTGSSDSATGVVVRTDTQVTEPAEPPAETTATTTTTYADGNYSAETTYLVPEGHTESIAISLTVAGDVVAAVSVDTVATNGESAEYQTPFDQQVVGTVTGKDLDDADLSRLSGASLTSNAFNDLLDAIRSEAAI